MSDRDVSLEEAIRIAERHLVDTFARGRGGVLALNLEAIVAKPYGSGFRWQTQRFLSTGDPCFAAVGMSPFLVLRAGGAVIQFGSAKALEAWMAEFERQARA